jgi:hypothetical protein
VSFKIEDEEVLWVKRSSVEHADQMPLCDGNKSSSLNAEVGYQSSHTGINKHHCLVLVIKVHFEAKQDTRAEGVQTPVSFWSRS